VSTLFHNLQFAILLQQNLRDRDLAEELVNMGVPKGDIVLGLQIPSKRLCTDYGVAYICILSVVLVYLGTYYVVRQRCLHKSIGKYSNNA
jgi:hypothetical protein